ncbi:TGS domain-containing protein [Spirochaeta thermophila DSM 6578]|uniref:TGS domain-containing protein n=1 Tax=Winmispira thermophila (strain ATCC 700085 / DSM 6578 / Z-1203) TaxID=869211 RepID=G0GEU8_WINT7|nr:nucleoside kinase [Spirochaeta thermophila]AEJ61504.1 TGS domain-containing protein [Spirochaeta thermophila DSM 6578]
MNEIRVMLPNGHVLEVPYGTRVGDLLKTHLPDIHPVAARVNNELTSLTYKLEFNSSIEPVTFDQPEGMIIYRASLCFLLAMAAHRRGLRLIIGHSLGDGYFYTLRDREDVTPREVALLQEEMQDLIRSDIPIQRKVLSYQDAIWEFQGRDQMQTVKLLTFKNENKIPVFFCDTYCDLATIPLVPRTGLLNGFRLQHFPPGFVLRFPRHPEQPVPESYAPPLKLFQVYREYKEWGRTLSVASVGDLNTLVEARKEREFIQIAEALHEQRISQIASRIAAEAPRIKLVLVAGPSSSGKTTFAKKLSMYLKVFGLRPLAISLDNYFRPREETPLDEEGNYDFEALEALDIEVLNRDLVALFEGGSIRERLFNFKTGRSLHTERTITLPEKGIVVIEGIHGLNEALTSQIPREQKYKIYVSALTQLNLDDHNRIPTTDNRLIRRMVRDARFRGKTALETIQMWPSVRRGEERHIFPFQEEADILFNSALDYELGVLKVFAEPLLRTIKPYHREYAEAIRLLGFLENFLPISSQHVPGRSILREFIGDSEFHY